MPLNLTSTVPFELTVDGEPIHLQLRRMTIDQFVPFEVQLHAYSKGRKTDAEPNEASTSDDFHTRMKARADRGLDCAKWWLEVFERYVTVQPGDLTIDGEPITTGARFVQVMARYGNAVANVLEALYLANRLSDEQKKTLASLRATATSSTAAPPIAGNGPAPATTVGSAAPSNSAPVAAATGLSSDASSGTTDRLSSGPAPSEA